MAASVQPEPRAHAIRVATALFYRLGYSAVTMAMVAEHSGTRIIDVYLTSTSKADLFAACLEEMEKAGDAGADDYSHSPASLFLRRVADTELVSVLPKLSRWPAKVLLRQHLSLYEEKRMSARVFQD